MAKGMVFTAPDITVTQAASVRRMANRYPRSITSRGSPNGAVPTTSTETPGTKPISTSRR